MKRRQVDNSSSSSGSEDDETDSSQRSYTFCFGAQVPAPCLQRELSQLPSSTREKAGKDVYGVSGHVNIPLERLDDLQAEIDKLEDKHAYEMALEMSPEFVTCTKFRMSFLRCTEGSAKMAAKRIARHFQTKLDLFGREKLVKTIELDDFDEYDWEALRSGGFQVLSQKDNAGRPILFGRYTCMKYREINNMVRPKCDAWI